MLYDKTIHRLNALKPELPRKQIMRRLGYHSEQGKLDDGIRRILEANIILGLSLCQCRGAYRLVPIKQLTESEIKLSDNSILQSTALAKTLKKCEAVLLMAGTVGEDICLKIREYQGNDSHQAEAVILDAVGSEMADAVIDEIQTRLTKELQRHGLVVSKSRFSPGFADFSIEYQHWFMETLALPEINIALTEACQLIPEKTVTAIAGIPMRSVEHFS